MKKPTADEKRSTLYLVATTSGHLAGRYVGETTDGHVVLGIGDSVRGFRWEFVTPVILKETE